MTRASDDFTPAVLSRRRAITILGAAAGLPLLGAGDGACDAAPLYRWNGSSLGAPARLCLYHPDRVAATRVVGACAAEIERLERVFALYRPDSELARLNRDGRLDAPSLDLLAVLSICQRLSALSLGAFDVTVQPLWNLYAAHFFAVAAPSPEGPEPSAIERARKLVDWQGIAMTARRIALTRPGMGVTLNGVAQGYVTDRIVAMLRDGGCAQTLADLGSSEIYAIGRRGDGQKWRIGLADPRRPETFAATLNLCDRALCTSGGYGTKFEPTGRFHHLFDPATGTSAGRYIAVSVLAADAMTADALSTALYVAPPECEVPLLGSPDVAARLTLADGTVRLVSR